MKGMRVQEMSSSLTEQIAMYFEVMTTTLDGADERTSQRDAPALLLQGLNQSTSGSMVCLYCLVCHAVICRQKLPTEHLIYHERHKAAHALGLQLKTGLAAARL